MNNIYQGFRELNKFTLKSKLNSSAQQVLQLLDCAASEFSFSSYMLNPMSLSFGTSKHVMFSKEMFAPLRTMSAVFNKSNISDIPDRYTFEGIEPLKFSIQTFLSVYDFVDKTDTSATISKMQVLENAYFKPLASLFAMYLPKRTSKYAPQAFIDNAVDVLKSIFSDVLQTDVAQKGTAMLVEWTQWTQAFPGTVEKKVTEFISNAVEGTVLKGLYENSALISLPAQYLDTDPYDSGGITFTYGPVILHHIIIDNVSMELGPLTIYNPDNDIAYPEYIKVNLDVHTSYRATADLIKPTLDNLKS